MARMQFAPANREPPLPLAGEQSIVPWAARKGLETANPGKAVGVGRSQAPKPAGAA